MLIITLCLFFSESSNEKLGIDACGENSGDVSAEISGDTSAEVCGIGILRWSNFRVDLPYDTQFLSYMPTNTFLLTGRHDKIRYINRLDYIQVVLILTGLNSALCCEKQSKLI